MQTIIDILAHTLDDGTQLQVTSHNSSDGKPRRTDATLGANSSARVEMGDDEVIVIRKVKVQ